MANKRALPNGYLFRFERQMMLQSTIFITVYQSKSIFFFHVSILRKQNRCYIRTLTIWIDRWLKVCAIARAESIQLFLMSFRL